MKKVLYFTDMPSPYKVKFLNLFSDCCDLTVYFERELHSNRNKEWIKDNTIKFEYRNIFNAIACFFRIPKEIITMHPDIVFNCYYSSLRGVIVAMSCLFFNKKMVIIADGGIPIIRAKIVEWGISVLMNLATSCMSSGNETNKYFEYYGVPKSKTVNYHFSSLTKEEISKHSSLHKDEDDSDLFSILYVGQIIERKGLDILLHSLKDISNISLDIVGGEINDELSSLIKKLNLKHIRFHGFLSGNQLEKMYKNCDIFVLPSRYEIWGLVVNEALSYNKPVITSNKVNAGLDLCEKYQCGLVFDNENTQDLHAKIMSLKEDTDLYKRCVMNCEKVNLEYTIDQMAVDFKQYLESQ